MRIADIAAGKKLTNNVRCKKPVQTPKNQTSGSLTLAHDMTFIPYKARVKQGDFAGARTQRHSNSDGVRGVFGAQVDVNDDTKPIRQGKGSASTGSSSRTYASSGVADVFAHDQ